MMSDSQRGGARHFAKRYVDAGILFRVLEEEMERVRNLGQYELISKNRLVGGWFTPLKNIRQLG